MRPSLGQHPTAGVTAGKQQHFQRAVHHTPRQGAVLHLRCGAQCFGNVKVLALSSFHVMNEKIFHARSYGCGTCRGKTSSTPCAKISVDYSAASQRDKPSHSDTSRFARSVNAFFLAIALSLPRHRPVWPAGLAAAPGSSGGNNPKLTFIGWKERFFSSSLTKWPPVIWPSSAPNAVVAGGRATGSPRRSAAAKRPARSPIAEDST